MNYNFVKSVNFNKKVNTDAVAATNQIPNTVIYDHKSSKIVSLYRVFLRRNHRYKNL